MGARVAGVCRLPSRGGVATAAAAPRGFSKYSVSSSDRTRLSSCSDGTAAVVPWESNWMWCSCSPSRHSCKKSASASNESRSCTKASVSRAACTSIVNALSPPSDSSITRLITREPESTDLAVGGRKGATRPLVDAVRGRADPGLIWPAGDEFGRCVSSSAYWTTFKCAAAMVASGRPRRSIASTKNWISERRFSLTAGGSGRKSRVVSTRSSMSTC
mmetsp:Transcript_31453/g.82499  ORF Transcript_31453/g.82499 Transcript_31453/m.82499 type:complete len:217 (+) Transcript_31453:2113-2763(+)